MPEPRTWVGAAVVGAMGAVHAGLSAALHFDGRAPARASMFVPREAHYGAQALFAIPLYLSCWLVLWVVASVTLSAIEKRTRSISQSRVSQARSAEPARLRAYLAWGYAVPWTLAFLVPDVIAYAALGAAGLARILPITMPSAGLATWAACAFAIRRARGAKPATCAFAALTGLIAQAALGGLFLR